MSFTSNPSRSNLDLLAELSTSRLIDVIEKQQVDSALKDEESHSKESEVETHKQTMAESLDTQQPIAADEIETAPSTQKESHRISLLEFVKLYPCYPKQSLCYKVFTDLTLKNELEELKIEDGALFFDNSDYFFCGKVRARRRVSRKRKSSEVVMSEVLKSEEKGEEVKEDKEDDTDDGNENAKNEETVKMRYIFPIESNGIVDLMWLKRLCMKCEAIDAEVVLAVGNVQSVV